MTILDELADYARLRVSNTKNKMPLSEIKKRVNEINIGNFEFEKQLKKDDISFICECKKASPSKGIIVSDFPYMDIAIDYENAGADAISVLTEPKWFLGSDEYLRQIASKVSIPCLRKDFTVDEYMIYEAKLLGAKAVLLICSILIKEQLKEYIDICNELGLSALVEVHNEDEIGMAVEAKARIIGVNNRNLKDFSVDVDNSRKLRSIVPKDIIFVAESGVKTSEDINHLREMKANAVLIGETLMKASNKKNKLNELKGI